MKFKTALFYQGYIAYYSIYLIGKDCYKAKLDSYTGKMPPPALIQVYKESDYWNSDCNDRELIHEIHAAIAQKASLQTLN